MLWPHPVVHHVIPEHATAPFQPLVQPNQAKTVNIMQCRMDWMRYCTIVQPKTHDLHKTCLGLRRTLPRHRCG
jgi:hypothetical protein